MLRLNLMEKFEMLLTGYNYQLSNTLKAGYEILRMSNKI